MAKAWFAPKRFGYGAGVPIAWQGWVTLLAFFVAITLMMKIPRYFLTPGAATAVSLCGVVLLSAIFVAIAKAKTEGEWRWRNGEGP